MVNESQSYCILFPDTAFLDRADIVQYVDLPSREAIYEILRSALCEIILKEIVAPVVCSILNPRLRCP